MAALGLIGSQSANAAIFVPATEFLVRQYANEVFEKEGAPLQFKTVRKAKVEGDSVNVTIEFVDANGQAASREEVVYKNGKLTGYAIHRLNAGETGLVAFDGDQIKFAYTKNGKTKTDTEKEGKLPTLINDMIVPFAISHWDSLSKGEEVEFRLIVSDRLETVGFKLMKERDADVQGKPAMVVKMKPTSFIIASIVKPLFFSFDLAAPHSMLEYRGRVVAKVVEKGSPKDFDGVTIVHDLPAAMAAPISADESKKKSP